MLLGGRVPPHVGLHGWRQDARPGARQRGGGHHVVSQAEGELGDAVGGGGCDDKDIRGSTNRYVADTAVGVELEHVCRRWPMRYRLEAERLNKTGGFGRHHNIDERALLGQRARDADRLVRGNAAGHGQRDSAAIQRIATRHRGAPPAANPRSNV